MICPALLGVPSALIIQYGSASLYVTRLLFSTTTLSTKFMVAPKSTRASVCTFLLYTQSVTGTLKEVVLLRNILLQDSSTTSNFCELIGGIHSFDCKLQTLYSTVPRENPIWESLFLSHLEEEDQGFSQLTCYLHWQPQVGILGHYYLPPIISLAML